MASAAISIYKAEGGRREEVRRQKVVRKEEDCTVQYCFFVAEAIFANLEAERMQFCQRVWGEGEGDVG